MSQPTFNKDQFQADASVAAFRFTVGVRHDASSVVAGR